MRDFARKTLVAAAMLPVAAVIAVSGAAPALATVGGTAGGAGTGTASAQDPTTYTMNLSSTSATIRPGRSTSTVITFDASRRLYGATVNLSVSGLPDGARAYFSPSHPRVGGHSTLTITAAPSTPAGGFTVTVGAIVNLFSSDPIGTTATFALTVG